jgi:hypothetical protein
MGHIKYLLSCSVIYLTISSANAESFFSDVQTSGIIEVYQEANGHCRGGPGNSEATWAWCSVRDFIYLTLRYERDYCYGKTTDKGAYEAFWHRCTTNSIRD